MNKTAFFLLILITYYLAGMYRYPPLMVLCGIELLLAVASCILPRYLRRKLTATFPARNSTALVSSETPYTIYLSYTGWLPVSRFELRLQTGYRTMRRRNMRRLTGGCTSEHTGKRINRHTDEYSDRHTGKRTERHTDSGNNLPFTLAAPYCGLLRLRIDRMRVYDYFGLFSAKKTMRQEMCVAVFPPETILQIRPASPEEIENQSLLEESASLPQNAGYDIRQLREYQTGDPIRHIHWNLSARTGQLWVKEYERETDTTAHLFLDTKGYKDAPRPKLHAFYSLLSALMLGLLEHVTAVETCWYDLSKQRFETLSVADAAQCRELLYRLYQMEGTVEEAPPVPAKNGAFRLTLELEWFQGDALLFRFSEKGWEREIQNRIFTLPKKGAACEYTA